MNRYMEIYLEVKNLGKYIISHTKSSPPPPMSWINMAVKMLASLGCWKNLPFFGVFFQVALDIN
jgi:hypothetical protein